MSAVTDESSQKKKISKVSIAPISPDALVVRIRKFSTEVKPELLPQVSSTFKSIVPRPLDPKGGEKHRATMADTPTKPKSSKNPKKQRQRSTRSESENAPDSPPCLKHAAENISRKAVDIPTEKVNLCTNCSKSMLSYIFLVQDFLDSLAKEIIGDSSSKCLQCAREEVRRSVSGDSNRLASPGKRNRREGAHAQPSDQRSHCPESDRHEPARSAANDNRSHDQQSPQFSYSVSPPADSSGRKRDTSSNDGQVYLDQKRDSSSQDLQHSSDPSHSPDGQQHGASSDTNYQQPSYEAHSPGHQHPADSAYTQHTAGPGGGHEGRSNVDVKEHEVFEREHKATSHPNEQTANSHVRNVNPYPSQDETPKPVFRSPMQRVQPHYETPHAAQGGNHNDHNNNYPPQQSPSLYSDDLDGIISTLSSMEREVYDSARNGAGCESFTENQRRPESMIASEAYVTSCRNNAEAIGCLVVGTSLLLCRTSRTLCVLVSDGVSTAFRGALSTVFQVVQNVRSLDSLGTTKLALLEQPDLGITFEKLNVWRLTQFSKCVYLNPDTLVIQNCDELFNHEELAAVPDIGWPDCFNSGVFVFKPSVHTFWALMEHADKQGSYDGGDQGLLNSYFSSWSGDISKKLSFVYNLMANVSYTYTPAFKQFGRNVKIVQFHGSFKPWHVKFFTRTGQVSPSSPVHPTYVQFVHIWLNIFRISVLRLMSQEIQSYASSQETICAVEILRFFPLPTESEAEFYLTPPSVRLRRAQRKLERPTSLPISEAHRRKSAEYSKYISPEDPIAEEVESAASQPSGSTARSEQAAGKIQSVPEEIHSIAESDSGVVPDGSAEKSSGDSKDSVSDEVFQEREVAKKVRDPNAIPGADIGDYHGMKAWEQGRMDYEGTDSSDNVLKRLQFLMSRPSGK